MSLTYKKVGNINNQYNLKALLAVHEALQVITSNSSNSSCLVFAKKHSHVVLRSVFRGRGSNLWEKVISKFYS